jgi:hypothetical protein
VGGEVVGRVGGGFGSDPALLPAAVARNRSPAPSSQNQTTLTVESRTIDIYHRMAGRLHSGAGDPLVLWRNGGRVEIHGIVSALHAR